jgi:hypothetical protein
MDNAVIVAAARKLSAILGQHGPGAAVDLARLTLRRPCKGPATTWRSRRVIMVSLRGGQGLNPAGRRHAAGYLIRLSYTSIKCAVPASSVALGQA